uniref:Uncharacterized protein n=1 Tax=Anguilla anguilla TaxID=7936 RepID=A0A0E9VC70_ANGAN
MPSCMTKCTDTISTNNFLLELNVLKEMTQQGRA